VRAGRDAAHRLFHAAVGPTTARSQSCDNGDQADEAGPFRRIHTPFRTDQVTHFYKGALVRFTAGHPHRVNCEPPHQRPQTAGPSRSPAGTDPPPSVRRV